ncbi:MAG TPA: hypothetical protein VG501_00235 [Rhizomicrobium sp.]|nr:hypothetical protein [Polyangiaceae bacterium]HWC62017.1 hypothetical protein [Rhizomicrobium sp.]
MTGKIQAIRVQAGACAIILAFHGVGQAAELQRACATPAEIAAIQVSAVQQELTDAALACGEKETQLFNRFQTAFNKELRRSDALMLAMFKRLQGTVRGNAAYDAYKTRAIAHAEQRRTVPGAAENFCKAADIVFAAALAPDKPVLEDFVAGVPVEEAIPVDTCEIKVGASLQGVAVGPPITPTPRPSMPGDPSSPGLFP